MQKVHPNTNLLKIIVSQLQLVFQKSSISYYFLNNYNERSDIYKAFSSLSN